MSAWPFGFGLCVIFSRRETKFLSSALCFVETTQRFGADSLVIAGSQSDRICWRGGVDVSRHGHSDRHQISACTRFTVESFLW